MTATIALKFLRNGVDSANSVANMNLDGEISYNFFENSLLSRDSGFDADELDNPFFNKIKPSTNFVATVGHSDMSFYNQNGEIVENPVFPYSLRYEPNSELSY